MNIEFYQLLLSALSLIAVIVGTFLIIWQLKLNRNSQFFEILMRSEKDFDELNRIMIQEKDLRDTYRNDDEVLEKVDDTHLKQFVFYELYYAHISRVYLMVTSELNPYKGNKFSKDYWMLYQRMLEYYLRDPIFIEVHESAKEMKTFEKNFIQLVDDLLDEKKNIADLYSPTI